MVLLDKNSNNNGQTIVIEDDSSRDKLFKRYQSIAYRV
ncbi:unnamed protein product, partial [Rotaria magnacalcarata]